MKRNFVPKTLARVLIALALTAGAAQAQFTLTILHNNDGESKLVGNTPAGFGGAAHFATVLQNERTDAMNSGNAVVTISSGDNFLAGKAFAASLGDGTFYDALVISALQYDAITLGNHDFDFGPDVLADFIAAVTSGVYISANLDFTNEPALQALVTGGKIAKSVVVTKNGEQIGIIGLTTPTITNISSPRNVIVDANTVAAVQAEVNALTTMGVKHIILSSHLQGLTTEQALVAQLTGVDVVIAGGGDEILANGGDLLLPDQTAQFPYPILASDLNGVQVPIVTTNGEYRYVGRLDVEFSAAGVVLASTGGPVRVARNDAAVPEADAVAGDAAILSNAVTPVANFEAGLNANVLAQSEADLDGRRNQIRSIETNEGNLVADAFLRIGQDRASAFGVNVPAVALANGGGIRNNAIIPAGPLSEGTTFDVLAFSNFLAVVEDVPLATFKSILENCVSQTGLDMNGNVIPVGSNTGRFSQIAGFRIVYNLALPGSLLDSSGSVVSDGSRIKDVFLDSGVALFLDGEAAPGAPATVDVVTSAFLAGGGDGFPFGGLPFTTIGVTDQQSLAEFINDDLAELVSNAAYSGPRGRIVPVSLAPAVTEAPVAPLLTVARQKVTIRGNRKVARISGTATSNAVFVFVDGRLASGTTTWSARVRLDERKPVTRVRVAAANGAGQFSAPAVISIRRKS